jgi:hypothetical protein
VVRTHSALMVSTIANSTSLSANSLSTARHEKVSKIA